MQLDSGDWHSAVVPAAVACRCKPGSSTPHPLDRWGPFACQGLPALHSASADQERFPGGWELGSCWGPKGLATACSVQLYAAALPIGAYSAASGRVQRASEPSAPRASGAPDCGQEEGGGTRSATATMGVLANGVVFSSAVWPSHGGAACQGRGLSSPPPPQNHPRCGTSFPWARRKGRGGRQLEWVWHPTPLEPPSS